MIEDPAYAKAIFMYNDHRFALWNDMKKPGGGNAKIRPYRFSDPPRAASLPTCFGDTHERRGYLTVDEAEKDVEYAMECLQKVLLKGDYDRVVYASCDAEGTLGTAKMYVPVEVKKYLVAKLRETVERVNALRGCDESR